MQVKLTANAWRRLRQIRAYYIQLKNPVKGRKITQTILTEVKILEEHPYIGQEEEYLRDFSQGHRYLLVENLYKVIYLVMDSEIYITDIFDTRQDPEKIRP